MTAATALDHVFVAVLAVAALYAIFRGQPRMKREVVFDTDTRIAAYWSNGVVLWVAAAAAGAVWALAGRPLRDLGLAWPTGSVTAGLLIAALLLGWYALDTWWQVSSAVRRAATRTRLRRDTPFMPTTRRELVHFTFLAFSAGVCEEVIFRGYVISYLTWFTGRSPAGLATAVTVPAIAFGIAHVYQGWTAVAKIIGLSIALGAIFLLTRSLLVVILVHVVIDLAGGLVTLRLLADQPADRDRAPGLVSRGPDTCGQSRE